MNLRPSVCIDAVFEGTPLGEACVRTKACGIDAVEFWCWWEKDFDAVTAALREQQLALSSFCTKFISLVDPAARGEYLEGLEASIAAAKTLGTNKLISQVGDFRPGIPRDEQQQSLIDGLRAAAPLLEAADIMLVIEPLNELVDHAGYFLVRSDEAFDIIDAVNSSNIKVIYDIYHQQISEGHLIHNITQNIDKIGHFHAAGNPGRNELTHGEIHYPKVFEAIEATSYKGYVALEYWPLRDPEEGLREVAGWFSG